MTMDSEHIAEKVRAAGIVGAGGAGFPTHVKLSARVDTVIANGAECEPLLRCDKAVMRLRTVDVLTGLGVLATVTGAGRQVLALKGHYPRTVARVREVAASDFPEVEIHELDNFYPAGDEQVLVNEVTGRVVPEGGIPLEVGVVVNNVITLAQIARAVELDAPVISRALTVAGEVRRPITLELPIGAPMGLAVEMADGPTVQDWVMVEGGPMMGRVVQDTWEPVTKRTSGIIVLSREHPLVLRKLATLDKEVRVARTVCCQCRMCTDLCPRHMLGHQITPHLAMRSLCTDGVSETVSEHVTSAFLCCLCGVCEVMACPLTLSPRKVYEQMRAELFRAGVQNPHRRKELSPHEFQRLRRIPLPRLIARLGLTKYLDTPDLVDLEVPRVPEVRIPCHQHTGAPAVPVVKEGDAVQAGDLIADIPEGKLGAPVHASISGQVTRVDDHEIRIQSSS